MSMPTAHLPAQGEEQEKEHTLTPVVDPEKRDCGNRKME